MKTVSLFQRFLWLGLVALLIWDVFEHEPAAAQVIGSGYGLRPGGGGIAGTTNTFYSNGGFKGLVADRNVFWDDFDGPDLDNVGFALRKSPSGHTWGVYSTDSVGSNGIVMRGGVVTITNEPQSASHIWVSNNVDVASQPWNRMGCRIRPAGGAGGPLYNSMIMIRAADHKLNGTFLHCNLNFSTINIQRGLAESMLAEQCPSCLNRSNFWPYQVTVVTNTVVVELAGEVFIAQHTNLQSFAMGPVYDWEIFGSATNSWTWQIDAVWAGYADPAIVMLADAVRGAQLGTNGAQFIPVVRPTLTTNTYLMTKNDRMVAMPDTSGGIARTNVLPVIGTYFGELHTIYDEPGTAGASNVWVQGSPDRTVTFGKNGPTFTNITAKGGSITVQSGPFGWNIINRYP